MTRRPRGDEPGAWHHLYNRAIAKRPAFLCLADFRYFLSCLGRVVRAGLLEVYVYVLMRTHFHLLARSPAGRLSDAMHLVQNRFSRYLNRRLRRDGALWRGRFSSSRVLDDRYHRLLVSYIDGNPVDGGVVADPADYAFGSAQAYRREKRPPWLASDWIDALVREETGRPSWDPVAYEQCFPVRCSEGFRDWVRRRLACEDDAGDALAHLLEAEPPAVRDWLRRKAALADGVSDEQPAASPAALQRACREARAARGPWTVRRNGHTVDAWAIAETGLLRDVGRVSLAEAGRRVGCARSTAHHRVVSHRALCLQEEDYLARVSVLVPRAIDLSLDGV